MLMIGRAMLRTGSTASLPPFPYAAIFKPDKESGTFTVMFPEFPDAIAFGHINGDNPVVMARNLMHVIFDSLKRNGGLLPAPVNRTSEMEGQAITFRKPQDLWHALSRLVSTDVGGRLHAIEVGRRSSMPTRPAVIADRRIRQDVRRARQWLRRAATRRFDPNSRNGDVRGAGPYPAVTNEHARRADERSLLKAQPEPPSRDLNDRAPCAACGV